MHPRIAMFPSRRFYGENLLSGVRAEDRKLTETQFDWKGQCVRFIEAPGPLEGQESFYHGSKRNELQAEICKEIVQRLQQPPLPHTGTANSSSEDHPTMSIAVLTPYTAQLKLLQNLEKQVDSKTISSVTVATIDSFQGREADIVVFCTVRCNANYSIGFLSNERRMNVAFTRAKRGLIVVGHVDTLIRSEEGGEFWRAWFQGLGHGAKTKLNDQ